MWQNHSIRSHYLASYDYRVIYLFIPVKRHPNIIVSYFRDIFLIRKLANFLLHCTDISTYTRQNVVLRPVHDFAVV